MASPLVLVIRENDGFSEMLRESGCRVTNLALTRTETLEDLSSLSSKLATIDTFDGLFFTSPAAADVFASKGDGLEFHGRVYALGERAKDVLERAGIRVENDGGANTARELIEFFGSNEFAGKRLLFVRGERSMRTIPEMLAEIADVDEVVVYRTIENSVSNEDLHIDGEIDWVCFFSPSGVEAFLKIFASSELNVRHAAAIGKTTARAAEEAGFKVDFISKTANAEDFAKGLIGHIKSFE